MNRHDQPTFNHGDPLPDDFSQRLRDVDIQLLRAARETSLPQGLADRVFKASVGQLNVRHEHVAPLRFVEARQKALHRLAWGRMAMAACAAIACCIAVWFMQKGSVMTPSVAGIGEVSGASLTMALEPVHASAASHYEARLGYLLETEDLTTDDLKSDLVLLVSRF